MNNVSLMNFSLYRILFGLIKRKQMFYLMIFENELNRLSFAKFTTVRLTDMRNVCFLSLSQT